MTLFTPTQKKWFLTRNIEQGNLVPFPLVGFHVYEYPSFTSKKDFMNVSMFGKNLSHEDFLVKEVTPKGFCRGNFSHKPTTKDFYIHENDLSKRVFSEVIILFLITLLPILVFNFFTGRIKKLNPKTK